jgi:hypothetical protein
MKDTSVYAGIVKMDDNGDGTLTVYGKATDDSIDIDQQICDPAWLDRAMPEWFMSGGNIREQHSNIAAGVAQEYEQKKDGHYISALVVDPVSVKKVKARVLKGFSIGIKAPRVVRDQKAANGRIIDGQIVEVSLVDRPANPNCQLVLAKSVTGEKTLVKTEELIEKHGDHDQSDHGNRGGGSSDDRYTDKRDPKQDESLRGEARDHKDDIGDLKTELLNAGADRSEINAAQKAETAMRDAANKLDEAVRSSDGEEHVENLRSAMDDLDKAYAALGDIDSGIASDIQDAIGNTYAAIDTYLSDLDSEHESYLNMAAQIKHKELVMARKSKAAKSAEAKEADGMPMNGEAKSIPSREEMVERYASARKSLDEITRMCKEYGYADIEKQYGESAEEETAEGSYPNAAEQEVAEARGEKPLDKEVVVEDNSMADKSVQNSEENVQKCLECGCNMPSQSHGNPNVSTAVMVTPDQTPVPTPAIQPPTPKSVETILPPSTIEEVGTIIEEDSDEEDSAEKSLLADGIDAVIEKAVKSAMATVQEEIAALKSAKEAVESKAASLETELATAKSLAIGGGPKRTTIATGAKTNNEWKAKADLYLAKASATTDNDLAKGYREMAKDYLAKAATEAQA